MQAFELIENNYSCRKSANRPVYKLSVDNNDNNQKKKKNENKPNDNNDNNQTSFKAIKQFISSVNQLRSRLHLFFILFKTTHQFLINFFRFTISLKTRDKLKDNSMVQPAKLIS